MELDGELMLKWAAWLAGGMVVFGDERPESGCLYSRSVEGSRDKMRCSTLCRGIIDTLMDIAIKPQMKAEIVIPLDILLLMPNPQIPTRQTRRTPLV